jgi:long-chain-fatty-acid--CoA ligase ACSBG
MPVFNVYGMTETAAPTTFNTPLRNDVYSVGFAIPGSDLKILSTKGEPQRPGERGEICVRGRHRFVGYYKNPKETKEMLDSNGYVHSGDEGYLDANGFLFITGRFKELIITAGGENIPPVIIEDMVKDECKLISNVLLVGDGRKFLAALITLKNITASDGSPSNKLPQDSVAILNKLGSEAQTVTEAVLCPKVRALVDKVIAIVNAKSTSRAQHIRKWRFLPRDFSVADGDLTPTMKMKRKVVAEKYRVEIEALYSDPKL